MSWVPTVPEDQATGSLAEVYRKARERAGKVPNIARLQRLNGRVAKRGWTPTTSPTGIR